MPSRQHISNTIAPCAWSRADWRLQLLTSRTQRAACLLTMAADVWVLKYLCLKSLYPKISLWAQAIMAERKPAFNASQHMFSPVWPC